MPKSDALAHRGDDPSKLKNSLYYNIVVKSKNSLYYNIVVKSKNSLYYNIVVYTLLLENHFKYFSVFLKQCKA